MRLRASAPFAALVLAAALLVVPGYLVVRGQVPQAGDPARVESQAPSRPEAVVTIVPQESAGATGADVPLWASAPVWLEIPAIGVSTDLMALGLKADGSLEVPPAGWPAGWYTGAPTPGERGVAVLAGHIDYNGPAVFMNLAAVAPGDLVTVTREDGSVAVFEVQTVTQIAKTELPKDQLFASADVPTLAIITCGGAFSEATGHYVDNTVVVAVLVDSAAGPGEAAS